MSDEGNSPIVNGNARTWKREQSTKVKKQQLEVNDDIQDSFYSLSSYFNELKQSE